MSQSDYHHPRFAYFVVLFPWRITRRLATLKANKYPGEVPNLWQVGLGILRMLHRLIFRTETVGTCRQFPVRNTWRARLLQYRAIRLPFLLWERAVFPLDLSGLACSRKNLTSHLIAAHHDANQFAYDLAILTYDTGALDELQTRVDAVVNGDDPRAEWLRDLVVFEQYHENLQAAVRAARQGDLKLTPEESVNPDIAFSAYLNWCAAQPATPGATLKALRAGTFRLYTPSTPEIS